MNLLIFTLSAPMMSFGGINAWKHRSTESAPTKSSIVGIISCAMGLGRNNPEIINLSRSIKVGVRVDRKGLIEEDFHTVSGIFLNVDGKKMGKIDDPFTQIIEREYVEDAVFTIVIAAEDTMIDKIQQAFEHPKWQIFIGRKSCVPSIPVLGVKVIDYADIEDAIRRYPLNERHDIGTISYIIEDDKGEILAQDEINGEIGRNYTTRRVRRGTMEG